MSAAATREAQVLKSRTLAQLIPSVKAVPGVSDVSRDTDSIRFKYRDKDGDLLTVAVMEVDKQRIVALLILQVPGNNMIANLASANEWNGESFSHGTFSYCGTGSDDKQALVLESHLLLTGGVTEENIRDWLENFTTRINRWEEVVTAKWRQIPTDTDLLKNGSHPLRDALAGGFGKGIAQGILETILGGGSS